MPQMPFSNGSPLTGRGSRRSIASVWTAFFAASLETGIFLAQVAAVAGFVVAVVQTARRRLALPRMPAPLFWLAGLLAWLIVSSLVNGTAGSSLAFLAAKFAIPLCGLLAALQLLREEKPRRWLMTTLLVAAAFGAVNGFVQYLFGVDPVYGQPIEVMPGGISDYYLPVGLLNMALTYAGMQMMLFLFLLPWALRLKGRPRWVAWVLLALVAISVVVAFRRGPWIGLAGGIVLYLLTRGRRVAVPAVAGGLALLVAAYAGSGAFRARVLDATNLRTNSEQERLLLWNASWEMARDHPLTGVGPGNWRSSAAAYIPERQAWSSLAHPHSDPFYLLAVGGFPALLLAIGLAASFLFSHARPRYWNARDPGLAQLIVQGGVLACAGLLLAGLFQCYLLDGEIMIALGLLAGAVFAAADTR
ncbi:MAG: hypothetical protein MAG453_00302 [Calditrichaeota bacterium]|nr:hypothetical protein [Calditrichota bacterium]